MSVSFWWWCFIFGIFGIEGVIGKGASIRKSTRLNFQEDVNAEADSLIYKPRTYHYYNVRNEHRYPIQQQVYSQPYYQPVYYQQPTYYYPSYYPSYPSGGGAFGFNFCLTCFSIGVGKK